MFIRTTHVCVLVLLIFSMTVNADWNIGKGLGGSSSLFGYNFDGPVERGLVKTWRFVNSGGEVKDCNSNCRYYHKKSGHCKSSGSNDCSTDCGCGKVCACG